jgi:serine protease
MRRLQNVVLSALLLAALGPWPASADPQKLQPRIPADKGRHARLPEDMEIDQVVIKFHEGTAVRLRGGHLMAQDRNERDLRDLEARGLTPAAVDSDVAEVRRLVAIAPAAQTLRRLFSIDEDVLADRRATGEERGGRELADLDLYYQVRLKPKATAGDVSDFLDDLNALQSIEIAYAQPPILPGSLGDPELVTGAVVTPNFQSLQGYLNAAPQGVDALYAWTQTGGTGSGVKIVDVEGGWQTTHEDLPVLFHTNGTNSTDYNVWRNHGTAVLGEVVAKTNGLGVTGIAYQAQAGYESFLSYGSDAIVNGAAAVGAGGIVLIPLHAGGPENSSPCTCNQSQCDFIPLEYYSGYYDAIANATANGVTVVELAGNGSTDLDDPVYGNAFNRNFRDSGAIILAASTSFDRSPTCWTNWGSRVDLHGWGENVATLGYADLYNGGSADSWYTATFSGTSSASPIVAGAAASVQGRSLATVSSSLSPLVLRDLLKSTGTPQVPGAKNIGPLPNLKAAFDTLAANQPPVASFTVACSVLFCSFDASASTDDHGIATYGWSFGDASSSTVWYSTMNHYYAGGAGSYTVTLTVKDIYGVTSSTSWQINLTNEDPTYSPPESYVALTPCRLFDTRSTDPVIAAGGILTSDQPRLLQMTGRCGIPADAKAVAVNVAAITATNRGNFQFYPGNLTGGLTATSSLNFGTANRANNAIVRLATNGAGTLNIKPFVSGSGQVHMVMDIAGYFTESRVAAPGSAGPLGFQPLTPCRIADSRSGSPLNGNSIYPYTVQGGSCGVPAGAEAASLLLTLVQPSANGNALLFPNDVALPATSTLNVVAGTPLITNSAITRLAATSPNDLAFRYSTSGATTHVILDTNGYFKAGAPLRYRPLTPCRLLDTRSASQGAPVLSHGVARTFQVQGNCGVPTGAKAVFLNVNGFSPTAAGSITAYAGGSTQPSIPSVNFEVADLSVSNGVVVPLGTTLGQDLALVASVPSGTVHGIVDVFGYFETDPAPSLADFVFLCAGLACTFDASASYDNFEIVNYHWSFGDSSSADTASVTQSHPFAAQGSYVVTLTVSDAFGQTAAKSWTVTVSTEALQPAQSYFALPPCRLLDTRSGAGGILTSGEVRPLQITGGCGVPASAKAVAVNLAAISATGRGNLQFYPGDKTGGLTPTSNLNFGTSNRANNAILRLGAGGTVKVNPFVSGSGQVHLVIDVQGYFSDVTEPGTTPLGFATLSPCRLVNHAAVVGGTPGTFTVQGACNVPTGATAAVLNTSIADPTANGNLLVYANGPEPATSTMNFVAGSPGLTNGSITSLATSTPDVAARYSAAAPNQLDLLVDTFGYFKNDPLLMKYHPIQPCRAIDTRSSAQGAPALVSNQRRDFRLQGNCGIPDGAKAVFAHVVAFQPTSGGFLFAYRYFGSASHRTLVLDGNEPTLGNGAIVPLESLDDGSYDFSLEAWFDAFSGSVNAIVDVFGYFE